MPAFLHFSAYHISFVTEKKAEEKGQPVPTSYNKLNEIIFLFVYLNLFKRSMFYFNISKVGERFIILTVVFATKNLEEKVTAFYDHLGNNKITVFCSP